MAKLNGDIKKLKRGELVGIAATVFCAAVFVCFAVCFSVAKATGNETLSLASLIAAPVLIAAGIAVAAYCNLKFGGALDKEIKKYIVEVFVENAALMHPEKKSLSFVVGFADCNAEIQVNGYKDKIVFDFSEMGKPSFAKKIRILTKIENRLIKTFCRLYEQGAEYTEVSFCERAGTRKKSGSAVFIIKNGEPDKKAFKTYLKD